MSCQAAETLRLKQGSRPLDVIQDVSTRWWSTFAMLQRMLFLRPYISLMARENLLHESVNLSSDQWTIVEDVCIILTPFKNVQQIMEGEKYVTISLIPGNINRFCPLNDNSRTKILINDRTDQSD